MNRQKAVMVDVVRDHRPAGESGDLTTCRCNGVVYETADWAAHVAAAILEAIADEAKDAIVWPAPSQAACGTRT